MIPVEQQQEPTGTPRVRHTEHAAQTSLLAVLRLCMTGKLRCSAKTRRPSTATVSAVADILDSGDSYPHEAIAAFAWPMLLQAGGLAQLTGGRLVLTARGRTALTGHRTGPSLSCGNAGSTTASWTSSPASRRSRASARRTS